MQSTLRVQQPARPILGIGLLIGSIYCGLSLFTYSSLDPSWNFSTSEPRALQNWGGLVGSFLADACLQIIGVVAYVIVVLTFLAGIRFLKTQAQSLLDSSKGGKRSKWRLPAAFTLLVLCFSALLSLIPLTIYSSIPLGGGLGAALARLGVYCFSTVGATLLFLGGLWIGFVLWLERLNPLPGISLPFLNPKIDEETGEVLEKLMRSPIEEEQSKKGLLSRLNVFKKGSKKEAPEVKILEPQKIADPAPKVWTDFLKKSPEPKPVEEPAGATTAEQKSIFPLFRKSTPEADANADRVLLVQEAPKRKKPQTHTAGPFEFPSLQLLDLPEDRNFEISRDELIANSKALEQKLLDFGVQGHVTNIRPGPIITLYEFEPAPGVKVKNILNLTDDLKLAMKAVSIRIIAPIPGRAAVGIEIPNPRRQTVYLREVLQSPLFQNSRSSLTMGMGKTTSGDPYITDLGKMPHLLIAGATGSGKSVGLNAMIVSMLYKGNPEELKFIMIDPKMLELSVYEGIPHLLLPVVTDPKKASRALAWAVKEMERRYKLISSLGARNLKSYNEKVERLSEDELKRELENVAKVEATSSAIIESDDESEDKVLSPEEKQRELVLQAAGLDHYVKLPFIVVVIDELADLIMVAAREVEESIARLAQMARAAGIHLMIATQRPSVDVITGVIKANLPTRCAFQVASKVDSRTIIDTNGAENLIGDGDMLFLPPGTSRLERLHGPFISEDEIARIVRHLKAQADPDYSTPINLDESGQEEGEGELADDYDDDLYDQALQVVFETKSPSASMIQRRLRVGYNRAARMIERMEREGIVSAPMGGGKGRELLITPSHEA